MTPDDRRAAVIAATVPRLRERERGASTREIATAAGIAEGAILRVLDSKDQLIADSDQLRAPPPTFVGDLRMLILSSVHPRATSC